MKRILITGGSGFLGSVLVNMLAEHHEVYAGYLNCQQPLYGHALKFDIRDATQVAHAFAAARPEYVIHTAALTKPDYCEGNPEQTHAVNVTGTRQVVGACIAHRAKLIFISTDLVFNGKKGNYTEDDPVLGINEYSRSKIAAEQLVLAESPTAVILRSSVLYGPRNHVRPGFLDEMLARWEKREPMSFFTDQYRNPTFAPQVAHAVEKILARPRITGLFHLGGAERLSRFEFARMVAEVVGAPADLLRPISMFDRPARAERPQDCSLISTKISRVLGIKAMSCMEGLSQLLEQGHIRRVFQ